VFSQESKLPAMEMLRASPLINDFLLDHDVELHRINKQVSGGIASSCSAAVIAWRDAW